MKIAEKINNEINRLVFDKYPEKGGCFYVSGIVDIKLFSLFTNADAKSIQFPLNEIDLNKLKDLCVPAVFGKGTDTIYDKNVRDCLQLKKEEIVNLHIMSNPPLISMLEYIISKIVIAFNEEDSDLDVKLHDLVIYEKRSFFKEHTDTEKQENMIGTLVISLPQPHTGGIMCVEHQNEKKYFQSDLYSDKISWCAFYADCKHDILPVVDGTRITLVYNITLNSDKKIGDKNKDNPELNQMVKDCFEETEVITKRYEMEDVIEEPFDIIQYNWMPSYKEKKEIISKTNNLIFVLEHNYSKHGFKYSLLKNRDRYIVDLLYGAALCNDLELNLGLSLITENWDHYDDDGCNFDELSDYQKKIYTHLSGLKSQDWTYEWSEFIVNYQLNPVSNEISNDRLEINCNDLFALKDTILDDAEIDGMLYQGNWGGDLTRQYRRAVVILSRK